MLVALRQRYEFILWKLSGQKGGAPHLYKQIIIRQFTKRYNMPVLVESGTYLGDMVYAMCSRFEKIYSIELAQDLFIRAVKRFQNYSHIVILEGDSGKVFANLIPTLNQSAIFWLDGHYSGGETARAEQDTPVMAEVKTILQQMKQPFVILIDDARLFVGQNGYPTLEELKAYLSNANIKLDIKVEKDIIQIYPNLNV